MNSSNSFFIIALLIISSFFYNSAKAENITSELHSGIAKYKYSFGEFKYYTFDDAADAYMLEKSHCITQPEFYVSCEIYDRRYEELTVYYTATTINDSNVNHFFHIQTITVSEYRCPSTHPYVLVVYEDT
ncbi:MAG: hypothetical protein OQJ95_02035, partial [Kangiella sp.]|nr:hypothetical protein [Kangiella sp.]